MFTSWCSLIGVIAAVFSIGGMIWSICRYFDLRTKEIQQKRFEIYHSLIKDFVQPDPVMKQTYVDRQIAIAFELRSFPEYYELSIRILEGLSAAWTPTAQTQRLHAEMKLAIDCMKKRLASTARWWELPA